MLCIAVTGSLASGKSTFIAYLKPHFPVLNCDRIVAQLYSNSSIQKKLIKKFGTSNKSKISQLIFSSLAARRKLEQLLHPRVWQELLKKFKKFQSQNKKIILVEVPLLFEANWQKRFDFIIAVTCPSGIQHARLKKINKPFLLQRIQVQHSLASKINQSDWVIPNNGPRSALKAHALKCLTVLKIMENIC